MPSTVFEPVIPASERPQTHVLERAATATGVFVFSTQKLTKIRYFHFCIFVFIIIIIIIICTQFVVK
jgi:hypothetical protein